MEASAKYVQWAYMQAKWRHSLAVWKAKDGGRARAETAKRRIMLSAQGIPWPFAGSGNEVQCSDDDTEPADALRSAAADASIRSPSYSPSSPNHSPEAYEELLARDTFAAGRYSKHCVTSPWFSPPTPQFNPTTPHHGPASPGCSPSSRSLLQPLISYSRFSPSYSPVSPRNERILSTDQDGPTGFIAYVPGLSQAETMSLSVNRARSSMESAPDVQPEIRSPAYDSGANFAANAHRNFGGFPSFRSSSAYTPVNQSQLKNETAARCTALPDSDDENDNSNIDSKLAVEENTLGVWTDGKSRTQVITEIDFILKKEWQEAVKEADALKKKLRKAINKVEKAEAEYEEAKAKLVESMKVTQTQKLTFRVL